MSNLIRLSDGTGFAGHIDWNFAALREDRLRLVYIPGCLRTPEDAYETYGTCPALSVSSEKAGLFGNREAVYEFLYGKPIENFFYPNGYMNNFSSVFAEKPGDPKEWTAQEVAAMDWDLFCVSYYTYLSCLSKIDSYAWKALRAILKILQQQPELLHAQLEKRNCAQETEAFWETVGKGLSKKLAVLLKEEECWEDYRLLNDVKELLSVEQYRELEQTYCAFADEIAKKRVDEIQEKTFSLLNLSHFDIEEQFFYKDYFKLESVSEETKQYVYSSAYLSFVGLGNKLLASNQPIYAEKLYYRAEKYARDATQREWIANKCREITPLVREARAQEEIEKQQREKRRKKEDRKEKLGNAMIGAFVILLILIAISTIVFGIMWAVGTVSFAKYVFLVCAAITVAVIIWLKNVKG